MNELNPRIPASGRFFSGIDGFHDTISGFIQPDLLQAWSYRPEYFGYG
jgi:ABC-type phosphate/phosphonate transport system permease subunit